MRSIVMSAKEILKNEGWTLDVVTTTDTQNFLEENYSDCEMMQYKEGFSINKNLDKNRGNYYVQFSRRFSVYFKP